MKIGYAPKDVFKRVSLRTASKISLRKRNFHSNLANVRMPAITFVNWTKANSTMTRNDRNGASTSSFSRGERCDSLVDPSWELIDPTPDVHAMFLQFNDRFFDGALAGCEVRWSPRMTTCAGLCCYEGRGGLCSIRLSQPLLSLRPRKDLVETLLHEMIHAYLFVKERNRDHDAHGPQFKAHMSRINQIAHTNITIYHSFHAEVANYKTHWWRCQGPCRDRKPFYGWVKRASNRAPGPNDLWWKEHESSCGGAFVKVREPEGYENGKKVKKTTSTKKKEESVGKKKGGKEVEQKDGKQLTLTSLFGGNGHVLGGAAKKDTDQRSPTKAPPISSPLPSSSKSIIKGDETDQKKPLSIFGGAGHVLGSGTSSKAPEKPPEVIISDIDGPAAKKPKVESNSTSGTSSSAVSSSDFVFVTCPSCSGQFFHIDINSHLDLCLSAS